MKTNINKNLILIEVIQYLDTHFNERINFNDLANRFHFTYGYLARVFKKNMCVSMKDYLKSKRLDACVHDLIHTNLSLTEIAYKNGFPSMAAFEKAFKKKHHKNPYHYRKEVRK